MANRGDVIEVNDESWTKILDAGNGAYYENNNRNISQYVIRFLDAADPAPTTDIDFDTDFILFKNENEESIEIGGGPVDVYCRTTDGTGSVKRLV